MRHAISAALTVAACAAALTGGVAGSAYAAGPSGAEACPNGTICLYYNSPNYGWGSFEHFTTGANSNLNNYYFRDWGNGSGYGQTVYKNAGGVVNNSGIEWEICSSINGDPQCVPIPAQYSGPMPPSVYNNDVAFYPN